MKSVKAYFRRSLRALGPDASLIILGQSIMLSLILLSAATLKRDMTPPATPDISDQLVQEALKDTVTSLCGQHPKHRICPALEARGR